MIAPDRCAQRLDEWDRLVVATPGTDVTQLSTWARIRATRGYRSTLVTVRDGSRLVGGAQVLTRHVHGFGRIGYLPYGPVLGTAGPQRAELVRTLGGDLARLGGQLRMFFVQPPEGADDMGAELRRRGLRPSTAEIAPLGSVRVDLTQDEEQIRARFSRRLRSWPNRWPARGVTVRRGDARDLPLLARLLHETAAVHGFVPPDLDYLSVLYGELARDGHAALFVGEVDGVGVCADIVTMCGEMVRGRVGGFDRSGAGARLAVPAAARWEIIRWARREGYRWLDFGGVADVVLRDVLADGRRDDPAWPSADRAKMAFGAVAFRYPPPIESIRPWPVRLAYDAVGSTAVGRELLGRAQLVLRGRPIRTTLARPSGRPLRHREEPP